MLSSVYRLATELGSPLIDRYLEKRRAQGREDEKRFTERSGYASAARPAGLLIWCHAASVGEAASLRALIAKLHALYPDTHILVTTGTVTSARMLENRLPPGSVHQYVPVDRVPDVRRFLDHWRPDLALWIESELWPNMLAELRARKIPAVLLNGRMSEQSFRKWRWVKGWAREILGTFPLCLAQTEEDRKRFIALGASTVRCIGNLKYAAQPLPFKEQSFDDLRKGAEGRPVWGMVSTHDGEETIAAAVHKKLSETFPNLLTIIVPRHAVRGNDIVQQLMWSKSNCTRRSLGERITPETKIYLADTMGELGLFYRLCPVVAMGGSFTKAGGHNPIEPALLGSAIVFGPHMQNFSEIAREFVERKAAIQLQNANGLAATVAQLLSAPAECAALAAAARRLADEKCDVLNKVIDALKPWLEPGART